MGFMEHHKGKVCFSKFVQTRKKLQNNHTTTKWIKVGFLSPGNPDHGEAVLMEATSYEPHYGSLETTLTVSQRLFVTSKQKRLTDILQLLQVG